MSSLGKSSAFLCFSGFSLFSNPFLFHSQHLVIKKLRYLARFIVVCLLLNNKPMVKTLTDHLTEAVYNYTKLFKPTDAGEWQIVLQEIASFSEADSKLLPAAAAAAGSGTTGADLEILIRGRLTPSKAATTSTTAPSAAPEGAERPRLRIQEAILVGNKHEQVKFSELTLDIYRLLQVLEREPPAKDAPAREREAYEREVAHRPNPHKHLLYRTSCSQLVTFLATSLKELADNNNSSSSSNNNNSSAAMLLYLSADEAPAMVARQHGVVGVVPEEGRRDGQRAQQQAQQHEATTSTTFTSSASISRGGVWLGSRRHDDLVQGEGVADQSCFYPHDLFPFLRRPLILIVDSPNSVSFDVSHLHYLSLTLLNFFSLLFPLLFPFPFLSSFSSSFPFPFSLFIA